MQTDYAVQLDLVITRGSTTENVIFTFGQIDGGDPYNLTGWYFHLTAKDATGSLLLDLDTAARGGLTNGTTAGTVTMVRTATQTFALPASTPTPITYSLVGVSPAGVRHETHKGIVTLDTTDVSYPD